ncbi:hypothetical protein BDV95DRAFT_482757 [Massariosphaeria phaeospora]|uniref:Uncharacterized protein n=1 Tax=Massariosphaeria phaeospora TaxID=100035 RepID=A0A7C8MFX3_9PLEO|nr:hypothetical protein BDV95DRAFT_482757 [Massariosphaeria phaeospora]
MNFVQNILWNSVEGFVEAGTRTAGGYAGDALIKAGDLIEGSGRSVGNSIESKATGYGTKISGQTYEASPKALPSTARKPAVKRSNSSPASTKAGTKAVGATNKSPLGVNKYPGGKAVAGTASKQMTSGVSGAKSVAGSTAAGAQKSVGGSVGAVKGAPKGLSKPYAPYGTWTTPASVKAKPPGSLAKPNPSPAYPTEKRSAVKAGQSKPFVPPEKAAAKNDEKKTYPGTNTVPGQASRTPVRPQKYKPAERLGAQVEQGQKMAHIAV